LAVERSCYAAAHCGGAQPLGSAPRGSGAWKGVGTWILTVTQGRGKRITGAIKDKLGKLTGDRSAQLEGKLEKGVGRAQETYGRAKDEVRAERDRNRDLNNP
jgi:uncharacterized protein YjbJ (UPF0337 family)